MSGGYDSGGRTGTPWWAWALAGCGGCLVIVIIAVVAGGAWVVKSVQGTKVGPVTQQSVQASLGEIPLYPNGTLDLNLTRQMLQGMAFAQRLAGNKAGVKFGLAIQMTSDPAQKVLAFYDQRLTAAGWSRVESRSPSFGGARQVQYRKGQEAFAVQCQLQQGKTMITLMRGSPEMTGQMPQGPAGQGNRVQPPPGAGTPR